MNAGGALSQPSQRRAQAAQERRDTKAARAFLTQGLLNVQFVARADWPALVFAGLCGGDAYSRNLLIAVSSSLQRIADKSLPTTLCSCCDHSFDRAAIPSAVAVVARWGDDAFSSAMGAVVCAACWAAPFDEMTARLTKNLSEGFGLDIRLVPAHALAAGSETLQ